jgi:peroxiredoxin
MRPYIGKTLIGLTAIVSIAAMTFGVIAGCGKKKTPTGPADANAAKTRTGGGQPDDLEIAMRGGELPMSLKKLVAETKDWSPAFEPYWGKMEPELTLTDINGNVNSLSKYRGKNVIVFFWRTNNATCKMVAKSLKELRGSIPEDSLAILSVSNEAPVALKEAATAQGINFVVLSGGTELAQPFNSIELLPTTFFIDARGRFKIAVAGFISTEDAKTIINAK